ncbi:MAG: ribonuclease R [Planctomycetaceae bacterium]|nr:ribonuclease R [Planctomycetaceae bacterium]
MPCSVIIKGKRKIVKNKTSVLSKSVLELVSQNDYKPMKLRAIAAKVKLPRDLFSVLEEVVEKLISEKKLKWGKSNRIELAHRESSSGKDSRKRLQGILRKVSSGNGYVTLLDAKPGDRDQDVFVQSNDLSDAQSGDEVIIYLTKYTKSSGQRCGRVAEVVKRATTRFVGSYFEEQDQGYVFLDGNDFEEAVWIGDIQSRQVEPDDIVVIDMVKFPTSQTVGEAVLVEVLGPRGETGVDTLAIIHEFGLPTEFSEEALAQAQQQAADFDETDFQDRLDLTLDTVVTIDPVDARDFDDAISLVQTDDKHWHLGVHIADVSHFVQPNTPLDVEALRRGTSVYLPTKVIPMLPEILSNGLASLQQDRIRFVKSVFIEFTEEGIPVDTRFANSVVKVKQRFSYEQAMEFLDDPEKQQGQLDEKVYHLLLNMQKLARKLRKRRFSQGALELNMPETRLKFDTHGKVSGAFVAENDESHQIIEEFMLAANVAVARGLTSRGVHYLRRTHGVPAADKMKIFGDFVESLGLELPKNRSRFDLQHLLDQTAGTPLERAVHYAFLRSLKQAEYSPAEEGHYALAAEDYCHFTSPIRRYPDLTVHRIVDRLLIRGEKYKGESYEKIQQTATHCCDTSRRAERAERDLTKLKLLEYMEQRVGEEFEAVITGVERFGIFSQALEVPAEGMTHISSLEKVDKFDFEREAHCLIGRRTGIRLQLGARILIKVAHVDISRRLLNFSLEKVFKTASTKSEGARKATKKRPGSNAASDSSHKSKSRSKTKSKPKGKSGTGKKSTHSKKSKRDTRK